MASLRAMARSCLLALLGSGCLAAPALATDADVSFRCCAYTPNAVRITPGGQVTWTGAGGATFAQHPLRFENATYGQEDAGTTAARTFDVDGAFVWYCNVHGVNGGSMRGTVTVTNNQLPVADFTASAADVASGTEITFDGARSHDPDGAITAYAWDLDGDGQADPGQTAEQTSAVFTNTGTAPRVVTVGLTVTDNNDDNVGPESVTKATEITVQPPGIAPPPVGGTIPAADTTPPVVKLRIARSLQVGRTLRVPFTTDEPISVAARLRVGARTARAVRRFATSGRHTVTLKLSKALRRLLRHRRSATLALAVKDSAGNGTTVTRTLTLKAR